jgi:CHAT domain-containing protein
MPADVLPRSVGGLVGLLREDLARQNAKGVYLVPCGALPVLPLHAVTDQQRGCLIEDFEVHYVPNARTLRAARQRLASQQAAQPRLTVVGNPTGDLYAASFEAEEVAALFSPHPVVALIGGAATSAAVAGALPSSTHVHLACHGRADMESPLDSALLLAHGERLSLKAVLDRTFFDALKQTRLVVLSACQTALVEVENLPEELMGLHAGFLQVGVPGVVGTLWSVNDISTAYLMIKFYQNLLAPERPAPASALRRAQLWLRDATDEDLDAFGRTLGQGRVAESGVREAWLVDHDADTQRGSRFAEPYFWAGFVFVGI